MSENVATTATTESTETETDNELPQWARDQITEANNEAARYRVRAREAADKARAEVRQEFEPQVSALEDEKAALAADLDAARLDLVKLKAALNAGIPGESAAEFAELLKGSTEEDITAHAETVKAMFSAAGSVRPPRAVDPSQGLGLDSTTSPHDAFGAFLLSKLDT
ncbi:hypothetical protein GCM10012275_39170 [Longimycelium tulufanense]|uniref:Scaffolding protein n=1 Tax=Longimycelium tulufanense TaxID=907463 RepID=A0A8J3CAF8_9PSEU|nr:hypothetical protein GCM10012275_39170 [Longimycelium tulufanense]